MAFVPEAPSSRVRQLNSCPLKKSGRYVLYWMISARRLQWNFGLQQAVHRAQTLNLPLVILEPIGCRAKWSSVRFHHFVIEGMAEHHTLCQERGIAYHPYVEPEPGHGVGLVEAYAQKAAVVITDDFPCYFLPRMVQALGQRIDVLLECVDSNGIFPMRATDQVFTTAHAFRRFLQKNVKPYLSEFPVADPLAGPILWMEIPGHIARKWSPATPGLLNRDTSALAQLPIDQTVQPAAFRGGLKAAQEAVARFFKSRLPRYADDRNNPEQEAASGLSPYLHFGHVSAHEVFSRLAAKESWKPEHLPEKASGSREGWWQMSPAAEAFLDELITWREVGYNFTSHREDYDQYESLPAWARQSLEKHAGDHRPSIYDLHQLETAQTHDELWNAAQRQLVREGRMHNYLRMLWGKKVLEWSLTPQQAVETLIHLNNKYAVDGRNPNSYSGIFWVFGRYDRAWGPERPIFGTIRYMSSDNTARKLPVKDYLKRYAASSGK